MSVGRKDIERIGVCFGGDYGEGITAERRRQREFRTIAHDGDIDLLFRVRRVQGIDQVLRTLDRLAIERGHHVARLQFGRGGGRAFADDIHAAAGSLRTGFERQPAQIAVPIVKVAIFRIAELDPFDGGAAVGQRHQHFIFVARVGRGDGAEREPLWLDLDGFFGGQKVVGLHGRLFTSRFFNGGLFTAGAGFSAGPFFSHGLLLPTLASGPFWPPLSPSFGAALSFCATLSSGLNLGGWIKFSK